MTVSTAAAVSTPVLRGNDQGVAGSELYHGARADAKGT